MSAKKNKNYYERKIKTIRKILLVTPSISIANSRAGGNCRTWGNTTGTICG